MAAYKMHQASFWGQLGHLMRLATRGQHSHSRAGRRERGGALLLVLSMLRPSSAALPAPLPRVPGGSRVFVLCQPLFASPAPARPCKERRRGAAGLSRGEKKEAKEGAGAMADDPKAMVANSAYHQDSLGQDIEVLSSSLPSCKYRGQRRGWLFVRLVFAIWEVPGRVLYFLSILLENP